MSVDHGSIYIFVTQQFLNCPIYGLLDNKDIGKVLLHF